MRGSFLPHASPDGGSGERSEPIVGVFLPRPAFSVIDFIAPSDEGRTFILSIIFYFRKPEKWKK
jgi:hypothetical protein